MSSTEKSQSTSPRNTPPKDISRIPGFEFRDLEKDDIRRTKGQGKREVLALGP